MTQNTAIQKLNSRLQQVESEITAIRRELSNLVDYQSQKHLPDIATSSAFVNKVILREKIDKLFLQLSIHGEPMGAEAFQKQMRKAGLASNELSQGIITARDE